VSSLYATAGHLAECPDLGPECRNTPAPVPYHHHVALFMTEMGLDASYGITPWLAAEARFALRIVDITPTYSEIDGTVKLVPNDIHHHNVTLVGPSDPFLLLRVGAAYGKFVTAARFGVSIPLGMTQPDPYALGQEGKSHEHTQFGSGTFIPIAGAGLSYAFEQVQLSLSALGYFSIYANRHGFRAPSRFFFSLRSTFPLLDGKLLPYAVVDMPHETEELWQGRPGLEGSTIRTDILAGAGLAWRFADPWEAQIGFRARVAQLTDALSFDYPGLIQIGLSTHFDINKPSGAAR
jgi:hypothetical protein